MAFGRSSAAIASALFGAASPTNTVDPAAAATPAGTGLPVGLLGRPVTAPWARKKRKAGAAPQAASTMTPAPGRAMRGSFFGY